MKWLLTGWAFQKRKFPFLEEIYAYQEEGRRAAARAGAGAGQGRQEAHAQQRLRPGKDVYKPEKVIAKRLAKGGVTQLNVK